MKKEWRGLIDQGVFDLSVIREYHDVVREAKQKSEEVHMARAHGIIVEKHSQLSEEDPRRKYKGRGVVLGNQIKNQTSDVQMADAVQAYIQATLRGTPSGSFKQQGCVSHPTPGAEIVAADVAMRAMGMPALTKFVFFDDNKAMISLVRSGKNPIL